MSRCSALRPPDPWRPTMAFADFCIVTARVAARRAVRPGGGCCRFIDTRRAARRSAWFLMSRVNRSGSCHHQRAPLAVQISRRQMRELSVHKRRIYRRLSPDTNSPVDCLCRAKGRAVGPPRPARRVPVGFAVMCQLASQPSALYAVSVRLIAPLALRLPPDKTSRNLPLPSARGYPCSHDESKSVLPQGTCTP